MSVFPWMSFCIISDNFIYYTFDTMIYEINILNYECRNPTHKEREGSVAY